VFLAFVARTHEERGGFVLVLPNVAFEVLSCGSVVSAHLCECRHGTSVYELEPLWRSELDEVGRLVCSREGEETGGRTEDFLVVIFQVLKEAAPFLECHGLHFGESGRAGDEVGEEVARVSAPHVCCLSGVLVCDLHLV